MCDVKEEETGSGGESELLLLLVIDTRLSVKYTIYLYVWTTVTKYHNTYVCGLR